MHKCIRTMSISISCCLVLGTIGCSSSEAQVHLPTTTEIKNVILVIGDGMGPNHIENTLTYFDLPSSPLQDYKAASVFTYSNDSGVTDSAAAATAMSTGHKVNNSSIAYDPEGNPLTSISTLAKQAGKKVGIVTTDTLDGATPAAFSAHAKTRGESQTIARGQAKSDIDLFIGQASNAYKTTYMPFFTQENYEVIHGATLPSQFLQSEKLVALLTGVRSSYNEEFTEHYQLKDMAAFALDFLDNDEGYFLMIEGAYIDKCSHDNQLIPALCEVRSLFDTVSYLYQMVGEDTAIIVTADHETGLLKKAQSKDQLGDYLYGSGGHSFTAVPLYIKNFTMQSETEFVENTEIFQMCKTLLKV